MFDAGVAHLVERHLAKVEVASSSLVTRSNKKTDAERWLSFLLVAEARKIKSDIPVECRQPVRTLADPLFSAMQEMQTSLVTRSNKKVTFAYRQR